MFCCSSQHLVPCLRVGLAAAAAANSRTLNHYWVQMDIYPGDVQLYINLL
jgi:hypothetical protein